MTDQIGDPRTDDPDDPDEPDDSDRPVRREPAWWGTTSLLSPEARALAGLVLASISLLLVGSSNAIVSALEFSSSGPSLSIHALAAEPIVQLCIAAVALFLGLSAMRADWEDQDDDVTWTGPVGRAAVIVATVSIVIAAVALGLILTASRPNPGGFGLS